MDKPLILKPCMECGHPPETKEEGPSFTVYCDFCGVSVRDENEVLKALVYWNMINSTAEERVVNATEDLISKLMYEREVNSILREAMGMSRKKDSGGKIKRIK